MTVKKKIVKKTNKKEISTLKQEKPSPEKNIRVPENYPVISFILFVVALLIWFIVGRMFMTLAVNENFCYIRYTPSDENKSEIVAVIDGTPIYLEEVKQYVDTIPSLSEVPFEMVYPQVLDAFINVRMLRMAADKANMGRLQSVQNAIRFAQEQIMAQSYLDRQLKDSVSEDELQEMYDAEVANYKPVPEVRAKHILVKTEKEARDVVTKLKAGDSFEMLAGKYSLDKSAMDGDLGYFTEDMMVPEFGKVVFKMKKGQISEPIKTPFGWHIVQVDDVRMSKPLSFEEVKNDLRQVVMERNLENVLTEERSKMKVQIKKTAL